ncbi:MAG: sigma-70 family RNA polymerase sigma factor [Acidobacteria bacterium]|nr:sigma-70 family RNA polymerase sigma factor [Acidobacteriota bacterium]
MPTGKRIQRRKRRVIDRGAFETESLALFGSLYRTALRLTKNPTDAEDLTQETYARALGASGRFQWGTNLKAWLFTILRNINRNRKRDRARAIVVVDGEAVDQFDGTGAASETPEARLLRDALSRDLRAAIESLPRALGQTMWLRDVEELSYAEIATRLDIPIGTVMSRLSRARDLLYRRLAGEAGAGGRLRR